MKYAVSDFLFYLALKNLPSMSVHGDGNQGLSLQLEGLENMLDDLGQSIKTKDWDQAGKLALESQNSLSRLLPLYYSLVEAKSVSKDSIIDATIHIYCRKCSYCSRKMVS